MKEEAMNELDKVFPLLTGEQRYQAMRHSRGISMSDRMLVAQRDEILRQVAEWLDCDHSLQEWHAEFCQACQLQFLVRAAEREEAEYDAE